MTKLGDRMRAAREAKGLQQDDVAGVSGYDQTTISDIENGKTASPRKWKKIADALDIPHDEFSALMKEARDELKKTERIPRSVSNTQVAVVKDRPNGRRDVPVYGRAQGGPDGKFEFNGDVMGWEFRPDSLKDNDDAYAVYVDGESMYPRYKPGEAVWVDPTRQARAGEDVIVQLAPEDDSDAPCGFIKEFLGYRGNRLALKQWNPEGEVIFDRADVVSVHPIVFHGPQ